MTCQEFEQLVAELSTDRLASARTRVVALAHTASCELCNARLIAEKKLDIGLSALAENSNREQAPARLKQSLRAEFEARQAQIAAEFSKSITPGVARLTAQHSHWAKVRRLWTWELFTAGRRWQAATAVAIVIIFAVAVSVWRSRETPEQSTFLVVSTSPKVTEPPAPSMDIAPRLAANDAPRAVVKPKQAVRPRRQSPSQIDKNDLATNYIPLSFAAGSTISNESVVIRVKVPRTTLIAMGLPLSVERGNEMLKADLRVGLDGVPLAIRLVRQ